MSDTPSATPPQGAGAPTMRVVNQYLKDLSFENPASPHSLSPELAPPAVEVSVDVNARRLQDEHYEVEIACNATATRDGQPVFVVETNYAGLFQIQNVPEDQIEPLLLVECPRVLFPFARQVIATASRDGGFLPLMLEPLDFAGMYRAQRDNAAAAGGGNGNGVA